MTWREIGTLDDRDDAGGDMQAGRAYGRRFSRPAGGGEYHVVEIHYYSARDDQHTHGARPGAYWVGQVVSYTLCTDPGRPGDTELRADARYDNSGRTRTYRSVREAERRAEKLARAFRAADLDAILRKALR
jgi:hypothetical protein